MKTELEIIFNLSPDMIGSGNLDGYFIEINDSFEQILGYSKEEFLKHPFIYFVHKDDLEKTKAALEDAARGKKKIHIKNPYVNFIWNYIVVLFREEMKLSLVFVTKMNMNKYHHHHKFHNPNSLEQSKIKPWNQWKLMKFQNLVLKNIPTLKSIIPKVIHRGKKFNFLI